MTSTLRKVKPGEGLSISAETFNAFVDAAEDFQRRQRDQRSPSLLTAASSSQIVRIANNTGADLPRFGVVTLGYGVAINGNQNLDEFIARPVFYGRRPAYEDRGKFAVVQEPIRSGGVGLAIASGITLARVNLATPPPNISPHDTAEIIPDQTGHLQSSYYGSAQVLYVDPSGSDPYLAIIHLRSGPRFGSFPVLLSKDGGSALGPSGDCDYTYAVRDEDGWLTFAHGVTPEQPRLRGVPYWYAGENRTDGSAIPITTPVGTGCYDWWSSTLLVTAPGELPKLADYLTAWHAGQH